MNGEEPRPVEDAPSARAPWRVVLAAARAYAFNGCPTLAAALAYYAVFSLPAVLVIVLSVGGLFLQDLELQAGLGEGLGPLGAEAVRWAEARLRAATGGGRGVWGVAVGAAAVLWAATSATGRLQAALNQAWQVAPDPRRGWLWPALTRRVLGLGVILTGCLLILVSLSAFAAVAFVARSLTGWLPGGLSAPAWALVTWGTAVAVLALLFGLVYLLLPDARVDARDALAGGAATALLFETMNLVVGTTLGLLDMTSVYGAAGTLVLVMLWLQLSASMVLFGAELTQALARARGRPIRPKAGAIHVEKVLRWRDEQGVTEEDRDGPRVPSGPDQAPAT